MDVELEVSPAIEQVLAPAVVAVVEPPTLKTTLDDVFDMTVKALDGTGDRFGGYLVMFGDAGHKDTQGDYFTAQTDFFLDMYSQRPVLYHHALDAKVSTSLIGHIDTIRKDDVGLWVEGQLNKRNKYVDAVRELIRKGALGWSSGTLPQFVKRAADGRLETWAIVEGSLTPTPAEPRMSPVSFTSKAHYVDLDLAMNAYKAIGLPTQLLQGSDTRNGQDAGSISAATTKAVTRPISSLGDTMPPVIPDIDISALVAAQVASQLAAMSATQKAADAAKLADEQRIEAEVVRRIGEATKSAPLPNPAAFAATTKSTDRIEVVGDSRFSDFCASDMAYYAELMGGLASQNSQAGALGRRFLNEIATDSTARRFEREVSAKAIKDIARKKLPENAARYLPFKTLDAVDANDYRPVEIKANELDNTSITNQGVDWVPTIWSSELWQRVRIANPVASALGMIPMPSNPFNLPIQSTDPVVYFTGEAADATDLVFQGGKIGVSQLKTGKVSLAAKKLTARGVMSKELEEDSIIPMIPDMRDQAMRALQNYIDDTILNGDTVLTASTNINIINGTPAVAPNAPAYTAFDGIRKFAVTNATTQAVQAGGAPTLTLFRSLRFKLRPEYAVDIPNLVAFCDVSTYAKLLALPEFAVFMNTGGHSSAMMGYLPGGSANQVGENAMPVGVIDGIPIYVSAQIGLSQTGAVASGGGKISTTTANNTTGTILVIHKTRWKIGFRRQVSVETYSSPILGDTIQIMTHARVGLINFDTASAAMLYDINVT